MEKKIVIIIMFVCFVALLTGCKKEKNETPEYHLSVDKTELVFTAGEMSQIFSITTAGEWHIEADGLEMYMGSNRGDTDWYSVEPISGDVGVKVTVELIENTQSTQNTATLKIIGQNNKQVTVKITRQVSN